MSVQIISAGLHCWVCLSVNPSLGSGVALWLCYHHSALVNVAMQSVSCVASSSIIPCSAANPHHHVTPLYLKPLVRRPVTGMAMYSFTLSIIAWADSYSAQPHPQPPLHPPPPDFPSVQTSAGVFIARMEQPSANPPPPPTPPPQHSSQVKPLSEPTPALRNGGAREGLQPVQGSPTDVLGWRAR